MRYPIAVVEGRDLTMFQRAEDLAGYIEAIDVRDDVYDAFDAEGFKIDLFVDSDGKVRASRRSDLNRDRQRLTETLIGYLDIHGPEADLPEDEDEGLRSLIARALPQAMEPRPSGRSRRRP